MSFKKRWTMKSLPTGTPSLAERITSLQLAQRKDLTVEKEKPPAGGKRLILPISVFDRPYKANNSISSNSTASVENERRADNSETEWPENDSWARWSTVDDNGGYKGKENAYDFTPLDQVTSPERESNRAKIFTTLQSQLPAPTRFSQENTNQTSSSLSQMNRKIDTFLSKVTRLRPSQGAATNKAAKFDDTSELAEDAKFVARRIRHVARTEGLPMDIIDRILTRASSSPRLVKALSSSSLGARSVVSALLEDENRENGFQRSRSFSEAREWDFDEINDDVCERTQPLDTNFDDDFLRTRQPSVREQLHTTNSFVTSPRKSPGAAFKTFSYHPSTPKQGLQNREASSAQHSPESENYRASLETHSNTFTNTRLTPLERDQSTLNILSQDNSSPHHQFRDPFSRPNSNRYTGERKDSFRLDNSENHLPSPNKSCIKLKSSNFLDEADELPPRRTQTTYPYFASRAGRLGISERVDVFQPPWIQNEEIRDLDENDKSPPGTDMAIGGTPRTHSSKNSCLTRDCWKEEGGGLPATGWASPVSRDNISKLPSSSSSFTKEAADVDRLLSLLDPMLKAEGEGQDTSSKLSASIGKARQHLPATAISAKSRFKDEHIRSTTRIGGRLPKFQTTLSSNDHNRKLKYSELLASRLLTQRSSDGHLSRQYEGKSSYVINAKETEFTKKGATYQRSTDGTLGVKREERDEFQEGFKYSEMLARRKAQNDVRTQSIPNPKMGVQSSAKERLTDKIDFDRSPVPKNVSGHETLATRNLKELRQPRSKSSLTKIRIRGSEDEDDDGDITHPSRMSAVSNHSLTCDDLTPVTSHRRASLSMKKNDARSFHSSMVPNEQMQQDRSQITSRFETYTNFFTSRQPNNEAVTEDYIEHPSTCETNPEESKDRLLVKQCTQTPKKAKKSTVAKSWSFNDPCSLGWNPLLEIMNPLQLQSVDQISANKLDFIDHTEQTSSHSRLHGAKERTTSSSVFGSGLGTSVVSSNDSDVFQDLYNNIKLHDSEVEMLTPTPTMSNAANSKSYFDSPNRNRMTSPASSVGQDSDTAYSVAALHEGLYSTSPQSTRVSTASAPTVRGILKSPTRSAMYSSLQNESQMPTTPHTPSRRLTFQSDPASHISALMKSYSNESSIKNQRVEDLVDTPMKDLLLPSNNLDPWGEPDVSTKTDPIRNYWQSFSDIKTRGSFDSVSMVNADTDWTRPSPLYATPQRTEKLKAMRKKIIQETATRNNSLYNQTKKRKNELPSPVANRLMYVMGPLLSGDSEETDTLVTDDGATKTDVDPGCTFLCHNPNWNFGFRGCTFT